MDCTEPPGTEHWDLTAPKSLALREGLRAKPAGVITPALLELASFSVMSTRGTYRLELLDGLWAEEKGTMQLIQEAADQEITWRQPSAFKEHYELRAGDEVLATLHWESAGGTLATARTAEGEWAFKRTLGFWQQRVEVRPLCSEREVATFIPDWSGGGILTVEGERTFRWSSKGIWGLEKLWQEREDTPPLIGFKQVGSLKTEARVVLSPVAASLPETVQLDDLYAPVPPEEMSPPSLPLVELPLLVTLGFYLMVLAFRDAAAMA